MSVSFILSLSLSLKESLRACSDLSRDIRRFLARISVLRAFCVHSILSFAHRFSCHSPISLQRYCYLNVAREGEGALNL